MSYSLNSLKGVIQGILYGTIIGVIQGDTRSLDYSMEPPNRVKGSGLRAMRSKKCFASTL